jgi:hypothetical protein
VANRLLEARGLPQIEVTRLARSKGLLDRLFDR